MIEIDFETYSEVDIKKEGAYKYAIHPSTEILCMAYTIPGCEPSIWIPRSPLPFEGKKNPLPEELFELIKKGEIVEGHNSGFEYYIWNFVGVPKYQFSTKIKSSQLRDSAAKAAALSMPRKLDSLAKALRVQTLKDEKGHRVMLKLSKPRRPTKNNPETRHRKIEDYRKLYDYCITDVVAEKQCSDLLPDLPPMEKELWQLDLKINERGVYCDRQAVENALSFIEEYRNELIENLSDLTDGEVTSGAQVSRLLAWFQGRGVDVGSVRKEDIEKIIENEKDAVVVEVAKIRQALALTSIKKFTAMKNMMGPDNRLRGLFLYHAASTGRWGGRGVQPQNLTRGGIKDQDGLFEDLLSGNYDWFRSLYSDVYFALSAALRGCLCAAPGKELIVFDYGQIEARVVMWLAQALQGLQIFRDDAGIYEDMAATIYKIATAAVTGDQRQLGKQAILGLGFGMGKDKFLKTCLNYEMKVSPILAETAVNAYRSKYKEVVKFWSDLEAAVIAALKTKKQVNFKVFKIKVIGRWLFVKLPSGRKLAYYDPKIERKKKFGQIKDTITYMGEDSQTRQWRRQETYGGKLCENVTQAVARDIMAHAMLNLEKAGMPIVVTVHDEVILEVPKDKFSCKQVQKIMETVPDWAKGLPVKAEGWKGQRYRK